MSNERKYIEVATSKMLNHVGQEYPYEDTKNKELQQEYEDEIERREPFVDIRRKLDRQQTEIGELRSAVNQLLNHRHDSATDEVMVHLKNQDYARRI